MDLKSVSNNTSARHLIQVTLQNSLVLRLDTKINWHLPQSMMVCENPENISRYEPKTPAVALFLTNSSSCKYGVEAKLHMNLSSKSVLVPHHHAASLSYN